MGFGKIGCGLVLLCTASAALAECPDGQRLFMSCLIEDRDRVVVACMNDSVASYRYGPRGAEPELTLTRAFGQGATSIPWPGVGRSIWEGLTLRNGDFTYEVYGGFDRMTAVEDPEQDSRFGGIVVMQDGRGEIARLSCQAGTVDYAF